MYFMPQISSSDCGFAALKILLSLVKDNEAYLYIHEDERKQFYSYQDIKNLAMSYGVELDGIKFSLKANLKQYNETPFIATIKETDKTFHAVVVTKVGKHYVHFIDPNEGKRKIRLKKFYKIWDGTMLRVKRIWDYPSPKSPINIKNKGVKIQTLVLEIFSSLSLIFGIFFIDRTYHFILPISFFFLFLLLTIFSKILLLKNMQKIDQQVMQNLPKQHFNKKELLTRLEQYKKELFITPISLVGHLLVCLFIVAITIINDVRNFYLVVVPLVLVFINIFFFLPNSKNQEKQLAVEEKEAIMQDNNHDFKKTVKKMHQHSYELGRINLIQRYISLFIMMLTAFLAMYLTVKHVTLAYTIFYFSIEMVLYEHFLSLLTFKKQYISSLKAEMKLINILNEN